MIGSFLLSVMASLVACALTGAMGHVIESVRSRRKKADGESLEN